MYDTGDKQRVANSGQKACDVARTGSIALGQGMTVWINLCASMEISETESGLEPDSLWSSFPKGNIVSKLQGLVR